MKNNQPVTTTEVPFPRGQYLVSRTDLKGRIVDANDAFITLSGFTREELIGQSHNIVRHPDMPPAAFEDMWRTLKSGKPWRGMVKNRCKNGDYYWVNALVVPVTRNGQGEGYMSVRAEPSRQQVAQAEALYAAMRAGKASMPRARRSFADLSLRTRLVAVVALAALAVAVVLWQGLAGMAQANRALHEVYEAKLVPANLANEVVYLLGDNRSQIALALQHEPSNPFVNMHDHPVGLHVEATLRNRERINELIRRIEAMPLSVRERELMAVFGEVRERFSREGVNAAREAIARDNYLLANQLLLQKINPIYGEMIAASRALMGELESSAAASFAAAEARYDATLRNNLLIGGGMIAAVLLIAFFTISRMGKDLQALRTSLGRIAEGDLSEEFTGCRGDELGALACTLAVTQTRMKVMLDRVLRASQMIEAQVTTVRADMAQVAEQSSRQQTQVESVAAATEEFSESVQEVSASVQNAANSAAESRALVKTTSASIEHSMAATGKVVGVVQEASGAIHELEESVASIGDITRSIQEIAEQTNLLALNAAIEAARAGEMGRGFAVVADEVRKLAERTASSTSTITGRVAQIQSVTTRAVGSMNTAVSEVESGMALMQHSADGLEEVVVVSDRVAEEAGHIAEAANQQATASTEVARSMEEVAAMVERNVAAAAQASQACDALAQGAQGLRALVGEFKV
ncbi:methyl-accepting chemotaxis protein [Pseudothauera lacus]|uniref:Methyl-accepting chemotaxis sensory transducer with Pas/Pac sensor n=1 Tax=Pseudothauera lacus TaxID=2136175 RepID=A0A2T4IH83_9RHOO|nr:methyl-accepting chemotaxis protein [Pseudothauera lacus]PTD97130.1 hypothetical protein C8261_07030 [Pseudothauera lacus]